MARADEVLGDSGVWIEVTADELRFNLSNLLLTVTKILKQKNHAPHSIVHPLHSSHSQPTSELTSRFYKFLCLTRYN